MRSIVMVQVVLILLATAVSADQVIFKNGDKITGKVETLDGGRIKITSTVAGEITVDVKDVATFSTDTPVQVQTTEGKRMSEQLAAGEPDQVKAADGSALPLADIAKINPAEKWTGSILVTGTLARGNTNTEDLGVLGNATLRRDNDNTDDRFTLGAAYNFGRQKDPATGDKVTTTDNWMASGKYDRFWSKKFYTYGLMKVEHDRIADLNYRLSPGVGLGYQWIESADLNFSTEAGISYVYEDYISNGHDDFVAGRLAYHVDKKLNEIVTVFHNLEWLPAFEDPGDYNLNADAGFRAKLTASLFTEFKLEWKRDSTPAPDAEKNDLRYILGVGWMF